MKCVVCEGKGWLGSAPCLTCSATGISDEEPTMVANPSPAHGRGALPLPAGTRFTFKNPEGTRAEYVMLEPDQLLWRVIEHPMQRGHLFYAVHLETGSICPFSREQLARAEAPAPRAGEDLIEKVARAIAKEFDGSTWDKQPEPWKTHFKNMARAAVAEVRASDRDKALGGGGVRLNTAEGEERLRAADEDAKRVQDEENAQ